MYLHLGNEFSVNVKDIVGIFDIENTTIGKCTKRLLDRAEKEHRCVYATMEMPKSFVIVMKNGEEKLYISQLAASTLKKRLVI
ncbi:MAG: extracellular matrix regulator RemB [Ruminococcus sp.]